MRQFTTHHTVYKFDELSEEVKQTVLDNLRHVNVDSDFWCEHIIDDHVQQLEAQGLSNVDIQFSGFHSQGDGASFTATVSDLQAFLRHHKLGNEYKTLYSWHEYIDATIERARYPHYVHSNMIHGDVRTGRDVYQEATPEQYDRIHEQVDGFEKWLTEWARDYSDDIYSELFREYDYLTSDEAITEMIEANEYEFYSDGRMA